MISYTLLFSWFTTSDSSYSKSKERPSPGRLKVSESISNYMKKECISSLSKPTGAQWHHLDFVMYKSLLSHILKVKTFKSKGRALLDRLKVSESISLSVKKEDAFRHYRNLREHTHATLTFCYTCPLLHLELSWSLHQCIDCFANITLGSRHFPTFIHQIDRTEIPSRIPTTDFIPHMLP